MRRTSNTEPSMTRLPPVNDAPRVMRILLLIHPWEDRGNLAIDVRHQCIQGCATATPTTVVLPVRHDVGPLVMD